MAYDEENQTNTFVQLKELSECLQTISSQSLNFNIRNTENYVYSFSI